MTSALSKSRLMRWSIPRLTLALVLGLVTPIFTPPQVAQAAPSLANCAQTVGTSSALTVTVVGEDCVLTFTATTTWTIPSYLNSARFLLVGGGAGGMNDGGGGGGGGGGLEHSSALFTPGKSATITIGSGGTSNVAGSATSIDIYGSTSNDWTAAGGSVGGGWSTRTGGAGGATSSQTGATAFTGGNGGNGPVGTSSGQSSTTNGANGFSSNISGTSTTYGGGGGGGMSSHSNNSPSTVELNGSNGGQGGGGRGAAQRARNSTVTWTYNTGFTNGSLTLTAFCVANSSFPGTTTGFAGLNNFGGGGGGGSAYGDGCQANPNTGTDGERNNGGRGGDGVVIIRFTYPSVNCTPSSTSSGGFTVLTFTSTTPCFWTVPTGLTSADVLAVGAGGGGGGDGGSGGGGGELRYSTAYSLTPGNTLTIAVGAGGRGGSYSGPVGGSIGSATSIGNGNTSLFVATGGSGGLGWQSTTTISGGTGGLGGTGTAGQNGGLGPSNCTATSVTGGTYQIGSSPTGSAPSNSITGSAVNYGGGGGGGSGFQLRNSGTTGYAGALGGGTNSGGRGGSYKFTRDGVTAMSDGASRGGDGFANSGGGGGGGTACDAYAVQGATFASNITIDGVAYSAGQVVDGRAQRTSGGNGAAGVVIIKYINAPSISLSSSTISAVAGTALTSYTLTNSGGAATYSIPSADSSALSAVGISFNTTTGLISGTPTDTLASRSITITATNTSGTSTTTFTISVSINSCSPTSNTSAVAGYTILTFSSVETCSWARPNGVTTADLLVVGGGGGGAGAYTVAPNDGGGGGGGGGVYSATAVSLPSTVTIRIGAGGAGGTASANRNGNNGSQGASSSFGTIIAGGGGGGGCEVTLANGTTCTTSSTNGGNGTAAGSGGGTSNYYNAYNPGGPGISSSATFNSASFSSQVGYTGGYFNQGGTSISGAGAPGGGARGNANFNTPGIGLTSNLTGSNVEYGKGGSAYGVSGWTFRSTTSGFGTGGDGQRGSSASGAAGAQGVVVLRYVNTYTITYNYNNATAGNGTASSSFSVGDSAIILPTPSRAGFVFSGWFTALSGGSLVGAAGASYTPSGTNNAITLYAQWAAPSGTVGVPSAPDAISVNRIIGGIQLLWSPPVSLASRTITGYQVEYSTTSAANSWTIASSSIASNATSYSITGLTPGTAYYVRIAALFSGGRGAYGYPWQKIYGTKAANRNSSNLITYETGFGTATGDAFSLYSDFTRIRYLMKATYASNNNFADVDFDKGLQNASTSNTSGFTLNSTANLRIPSIGTNQQFITQGDVYDMTVLAPSTVSVQNGYGFNGRVEFWPWNYDIAAPSGLSARATNTYDDADTTPGNGTYGSFQIHNITNGTTDYRQTVFAWNNHGTTAAAEIGFGNNTGTHSDWTFCSQGGSFGSCASRTNFSVEIFINPPTTVTNVGNLITVTQGANGTISPGTTNVAIGANQTFTFTPNVGYEVDSIIVDGTPISTISSPNFTALQNAIINGYTFTNVTSARTITATYAPIASTNLLLNLDATKTSSLGSASGTTSPTWTSITPGNTSATANGTTKTQVSTGTTTSPNVPKSVYFNNIGTDNTASSGASFNYGTTTGVTLGTTGSNVPVTVEMWVNPTQFKSSTTNPWNILFTKWFSSTARTGTASSQEFHYAIKYDGATLRQNLWTSNCSDQYGAKTFSSADFNKWVLLGWTVDTSGNLQFYINGKPDGSVKTGCGIVARNTPLAIVGDLSQSVGFTGSMARVRMYNTALSAATMKSNYNAEAELFALAPIYTVTYDYTNANGGNSVAFSDYDFGGTAITLPTPTRSGSIFNGWYTAASGGTLIGAGGASYVPTSNVTIYAQWTSCGSAVVQSSLILHLDAGNNCSSTGSTSSWVDISTAGNNATLYNTPTYSTTNGKFYTFGPTGLLSSSSTGKYGQIPSLSTSFSTGISITFFGRFTNTVGVWERIIDFGSGNNNNNILLARLGNTSQLVLEFYNGANSLGTQCVTDSGAIVGNEWAHFAFTVDSTNGCRIYKNGVLIKTVSSYTTMPATATRTTNYIARSNWGADNYFTGAIGDLAVYNSALTASQVASNFVAQADVTYSVTYNANGSTSGSVPVDSSSPYLAGSSVTVRNNSGTLARTGFTFAGWNTAADGSGTSYAATGLATFTMGSANVILYARWTANSYTVTYDGNGSTGGSVPTDASTYTAGSTVTVKTNSGTLVRTGYTFSGWNSATNGSGIDYAASGSATFTMGSANTTLYAKWSGNQYAYNANTGTGTTASQTFSGTALTAQANGFTPPNGYSFSGWCTTQPAVGASCGGTPYAVGATLPTPSSTTVTLFAVWSANALSITYQSGGGSGSAPTSPATVRYAGTFVTPSNTFSRTGYTFAGWSDGTNTYAAGATYPASGTVTNAVTLTATWTGVTYTITYSAGTGATGSDVTQTFVFPGPATLRDSATALTKVGFVISGWTTTNGGTSITHSLSGSYSTASNLQLYPVWAAGSYTVTYKAGANGTGSDLTQIWTYPGPITLFSASDASTITRANYRISGWSTSDGSAQTNALSSTYSTAGNVTLYPVWAPLSYVVTYSSETANSGAPSILSDTYTVGTTGLTLATVGTMAKTGHTFAGWSTTNGGAANTLSPYQTLSDITLYAAWTASTYSVTFNSQGGSSVSNGTFTFGGSVSAPTPPTRSGYSFNGWFTSGSGGSALTFPYFPSGSSAITLYAQWSAIPYSVTYQLNDGTGTAPTETSKNISNTFLVASIGAVTKVGYTFAGWNDGTSTYQAGATYTVGSSNVVFKAQWATAVYTVTYSANGGTGSASRSSDSFIYGSSAFNLPTRGTLAKTGYSFAGWATGTDGTGAITGAYTPTSTITLYAIWNASTYTIKYNINGGTGSTPSDATYTTGAATGVTLPTSGFSRTGYALSGWSESPSGSPVSNTYTTTQNITLYAIWTLVTVNITYSKGTLTGESPAVAVPSSVTPAPKYGDIILLGNVSETITVTGSTTYAFAGWRAAGITYPAGSSFNVGDSNVEFVAQWVQVFTLSYLPNGGTGTLPADSQLTDGADFTTNSGSGLTRPGYTLKGWKDQAGIAIDTSTATKISSTRYILSAVWEPISYKVTYDSVGASTTPSDQFNIVGEFVTLAAAPSKPGYSFNGWLVKSVLYGAGSTFLVETGTATTGTTLIDVLASWTANNYSVSYDLNGGTSSTPSPEAKAFGSIVTLPSAPTRPGFNFNTWSASSGGNTGAGLGYSMPAQDVLFTAQWTPIDYSVTYVSNGGSTEPSSLSGKRLGDTFIVGNAVTQTSREFLGWSDGVNTYLPGQTYTVRTSNITLTALWSGELFSVTYSANGGSGAIPIEGRKATGDTFVVASGASLTRPGYEFTGWQVDSTTYSPGNTFTMGSGPVTLTAQWNRQTIVVTFNSNYGSPTTSTQNIAADSPTNLTSNSFTRANYTFGGWTAFSDGTGTTYSDGASATLTSNLTLYAKWIPAFVVDFDSAGGSPVSSLTYTGTPLNKPTDPVRSGYTFTGWSNGSRIVNWSRTPLTSETLTAQWSATIYTLNFNSNGGTSVSATNFTTGQSISAPTNPTRVGYAFNGWFTASSGGTQITFPYSPSNSSETIYAQWLPSFDVTFDSDGGSSVATLQFTGTPLEKPADPTRENFAFAGWKNGATSVNWPFSPTESANLKATWNPTAYVITYNAGTNGVSPRASDVFTIGGSAVTLPKPTRSGFTFNGWFDSASNGSKIADANSSFTPTATRTLYAQWIQTSLYGVNQNALTPLGTLIASGAQTSISASAGGSSVTLTVPGGALPDGTVVTAQLVGDFSRASALINNPSNFILSMVISWLATDGTVPVVPVGKDPLSVTVTNSSIKAGSTIYSLLGDSVTVLTNAVVIDGSATFTLREDPEVLVALSAPPAPAAPTAVAGDGEATISWSPPSANGGSAISGYLVTSSGGQTCNTTGALTCTVKNLTNGTAYTFTVAATNTTGTGTSSEASNSVTPKGSSGLSIITAPTGKYGVTQTITANLTKVDGNVNFKVGNTSISGCSSVASSSLLASCNWTPATTGPEVVVSAVLTPTDSSYLTATSETATVNVGPREIVIKAADKNARYNGSSVSVNNAFSIVSGNLAGNDAISGMTYTYTSTGGYNSTTAPTDAGTYTITPSSPVFSTGSASNYIIGFVSGTLNVGLNVLIVSFNSAPANVKVGLAPGARSVSATTSPTGIGAIVYGSTTTSVCTVNSSTGALTLLTAGTCTVTAENAGDSNHTAAPQETQSFTVSPMTITYSPNGGAGTPFTKTISDLNPVTLIKNTFTRSGYNFGGWSAGGVTYKDEQSNVNFTADTTLSAVWNLIPVLGGADAAANSTAQVALYFKVVNPDNENQVSNRATCISLFTRDLSPQFIATSCTVSDGNINLLAGAGKISIQVFEQANQSEKNIYLGEIAREALTVEGSKYFPGTTRWIVSAPGKKASTPTPTPTPTPTSSSSPNPTPSASASPSPTSSATATPKPSPTPTSAATPKPVLPNDLNPVQTAIGLKPGEFSTLVDGKFTAASIKPTAKRDGLEISGNGWSLSIYSINSRGKVIPLPANGILDFRVNGKVRVSGTGSIPNAELRIYLLANVTLLEATRSDNKGGFSYSLDLPSEITQGTHVLQVNTRTPSKQIRSLSIGLYVNPASNSVIPNPSSTVKPNPSTSPTVSPTPTPSSSTTSARPVVPFSGTKYGISVEQLRAIKRLDLSGKKVRVYVVGYVKATGTREDLRISLDRAIEVKKAILKLAPKAKVTVLGGGGTVAPECRAVSNQCVTVRVAKG